MKTQKAKMPNTPKRMLTLAVMMTLPVFAHAQQAPETPVKEAPKKAADVKKAAPDTGAVQKVEVQGAKAYDERRQDTATKIVVTQEEIVRFGDTTVGDVLKRLPGVTIGGVQGRGGEIRMRGLGAGYTQILLNGEPRPPGFSLDSISPDLIERIEVIRAATAELSTQAVAGAINIVLKRAIQTAQREIKAGGQSDGGKYGANVNFQISDKAGTMSYSVSGNLNHGKFERPSYSTTQYFDTTGKQTGNQRTDSNNWGTFDGLGMSPRVNWNLPNGDIITSQSFINANRFRGYNSEVTAAPSGPQPQYLSDIQRVTSEFAMLRSNLNWIHRMADSAKLDVKFGVNLNKRESDVDLAGFGNNGASILNRSTSSSGTAKGWTTSGKYSTPFIEDHSVVFGWDAEYSKRNETRTQADVVTADPVTGTKLTPINLNEDFDATVSRLALFAQDEWNVTKQWSVYAGLRWEGLETKSSGNTYADVKNRSSVFSPILQTLYKLPDSKNDQLRFGLTRTYKAPDTNSLIPRRFLSTDNKQTNPDSTGNPNLKPELAWGLDLAYEHYMPQGGVLSASVYMRKITDVVITQLNQIDGRWVSMPANAGNATTKGIELDAKMPLRALMDNAPSIDLRANASFNFSDLSSVPGPNNRLASQTPVSANIGVDYKIDGTPLTVGGNYGYQGAGEVRIAADRTAYSTPKRVVDVYALWKFDPKTSLRASVSNWLHQDNLSQSTYYNAAGSIVQTNYTPTTVTFRAMFEHKF